MKTLILIIAISAISTVTFAQGTSEELTARISAMESRMDHLDLRLDQYKVLNNSAGALFIAGLAVGTYHFTFGDEKTDMLIPAVAACAISTGALYFTANTIRRKVKK